MSTAVSFVQGPELVLTEAPLPSELRDEILFRVVGLAVADPLDESPVIAIADQGNYRLVFWWPSEGRVQEFGREGAGPGEFLRIRSVWSTDGLFMVSDPGNGRLMVVNPEQGAVGTAPWSSPNLAGGGAFLAGGLLVIPADDTSLDPFQFRHLAIHGDGIDLGSTDRPGWFSGVGSLDRAVHPLYEEVGLGFPPAMPFSTDIVVPLGDQLVWVEQRRGTFTVLPLGGNESDSHPRTMVALIPENVIGTHARAWAETLGETGMRERHFQAFWSTRPDVGGRRALLSVPLATGDPLGWLLEAREDGTVEGRVTRLAAGEELTYPVRAALPLSDDHYLVGHEGGVTLFVEQSAR